MLSLLIVNPMGGEGWGGVERWLMDVARGLLERGHRVATAGRPGSLWLRRCVERGIPTVEVPLRRDFHLGQARKLSRFMLEHEVDVVATKLHRGIRAAGFAAKLAGAPPVAAFMGLVETRPGLRYRLTYELFLDGIVTLSDAMADGIAERGDLARDDVAVIPYGVVPENYVAAPEAGCAVRAELGVAPEAPLSLALGRLNDQKRFDILLDTFERVRAQLPQARLVIAGTGKLEEELIRQRSERGLDDAVVFAGFRRDVPALLQAADTLVLSSDDEGLPHVVLEAMAAGVPTVSTRVGSIDLLVEEGRTGLLVPPRDPARLAEGLVSVLGDLDRAREMGRAAAAKVRAEFPLDRCIDRTAAYLTELRDRNDRPRAQGQG